MPKTDNEDNELLMALTRDIVSAHLGNNPVRVEAVSGLIVSVYNTLKTLDENIQLKDSRPDPAVSIRSSVKPDYIVCLEDGKKVTMLKRYLRTKYSMSPEEYRTRWSLAADYPMVAPNYAEKRRDLAKKIGLGRQKVAAYGST